MRESPASPDARPDPTPFARFPWGPALLCVGCLVMCAYTWMRYSFCWEAMPFPTYITRPNNLEGRFVRTSGRCKFVAPGPGDYGEPFVLLDVPYTIAVVANRHYEGIRCAEDMHVIISSGALYEEGETVTFTGRVLVEEDSTDYPDIVAACLDTTASRFHPASIAGLVVAAMGAFVFGLYLRRYMKERRVGG